MACVGHGGDCGGDPPPPGGWNPGSSCQRSNKVRGEYTSQNVRDQARKLGRKLPIMFDTRGSYDPIGPNGDSFSRYLKMTVANCCKMHYPSWDQVPQEERDAILPRMMEYWDLEPWFARQDSKVVLDWLGELFRKAYRDKKADFKSTWWTKRGGYDSAHELRRQPPPKVSSEDWGKFCDFVTDPAQMTKSERNKVNRSKQTLLSTHGGNSFAQKRWKHRNKERGEDPSYVEEFGKNHTKKSGGYICDQAADLHNEMVTRKNSQPETASSNDDAHIVEDVMGTRSGHSRGIGRKKKSISEASTSRPQPQPQP